MFWEIAFSVISLASMIFARKTVPYFQESADEKKQAKRLAKAALATTIVKGVVGLFKHSNGLSELNAAQLQVLIEQAYAALVGQGFSPAKARGIAEREIAQAL